GVEPVQLVFLRHVDQREQVAPDPAPGRLHHAGGRIGGDGGVDRVAAALEDLHSCGRGEGLAGSDHTVSRGDDGAAGDGCAGGGFRGGGCGEQDEEGDCHGGPPGRLLYHSV